MRIAVIRVHATRSCHSGLHVREAQDRFPPLRDLL